MRCFEQILLDTHRQDRFTRLACDRNLIVQQHVLGDLLGDGGCADRPSLAHMRQVEGGGAHDRQRIDPWMRPEMLILGRYEGVLHHVGDRRIRHEDATLRGKLRHQPRVAGVDAAHHRRAVVAQPVDVRQVRAEALPREVSARAADHAHQQPDGEQPAHHATHEPAEQTSAALARRRRLAPAALAIVRRRWHQFVAGGQRFAHGCSDMVHFDAADQQRER